MVVFLFVEAGNEKAFPLTFAHVLHIALFITLGVIARMTTIYLTEIPVSCRREIETRHEESIGTKNVPAEKPKKMQS